MNRPDEAIDKVLAGLRNADPPPGMERRIHEALQHHAVAPSRPRRRTVAAVLRMLPRPAAARSFAPGLVLATLAAVVVLTSAILAPRGIKHMSTRPKTNETSAASPESLPRTTPTVVANNASPPVPGSSPRPSGRPRQRRAPSALGSEAVAEASIASSATFAPSHPAPPLPLTEQERLLLRIAHKGDPVEIAMLNPEYRAREQALGKAQFQQFFEPASAKDNQQAASSKGDIR